MMPRAREVLGRPHPFEPTPAANLLYGLGCGLFVFLFFAAFEPFGFFLLPEAPRRALYVGYGLVTGLAIALNGLLLPRLLPRLFREERWSLGRQILWMGWVTLTIGLGCYLLSGALCAQYGLSAHWVRMRVIVLDTFLIAIFPITLICLADSARLLQRSARVVAEANRHLERPAAPPPAAGAGSMPQVRIVGENDRDAWCVALDDMLFIQAEENYVRLHACGEKPGPPLLRSSLTRVERQLRPFYPRLFRCHRAYVVNTGQIAGVGGNAQGLRLSLKDSAAVVPVARRYVNEFRRVIPSL
ncbi:MAG: LytTR family transcriptional regulator DNA-binding domain-containing protein [Candidatus Aminicenantes bacterium]|nr:LytTR family transcriptional regulator DNA-binding domain-containing protein [Candidatus Aminicenantes bacterium]